MNKEVTTDYYEDVWVCFNNWGNYCFETPVHFLSDPGAFYSSFKWEQDNIIWKNGEYYDQFIDCILPMGPRSTLMHSWDEEKLSDSDDLNNDTNNSNARL